MALSITSDLSSKKKATFLDGVVTVKQEQSGKFPEKNLSLTKKDCQDVVAIFIYFVHQKTDQIQEKPIYPKDTGYLTFLKKNVDEKDLKLIKKFTVIEKKDEKGNGTTTVDSKRVSLKLFAPAPCPRIVIEAPFQKKMTFFINEMQTFIDYINKSYVNLQHFSWSDRSTIDESGSDGDADDTGDENCDYPKALKLKKTC